MNKIINYHQNHFQIQTIANIQSIWTNKPLLNYPLKNISNNQAAIDLKMQIKIQKDQLLQMYMFQINKA